MRASSCVTLFLATLVVAGCDGGSTSPSSKGLRISARTAGLSCGLHERIALPVTVTTAAGQPAGGVEVTFTILSGGDGTLVGGSLLRTDAAGQTASEYECAVESSVIEASCTDCAAAARFAITSTLPVPGPVARIVLFGWGPFPLPEGQAAAVGRIARLVAQPQDALGVPVRKLTTVWAVASGQGSLASTTADPDPIFGTSQNFWTLGPAPGEQSVTVSLRSVPGISATLHARGVSGPLTVVAENPADLVGKVGEPLSQPLTFRVLTPEGQPFSGARVQLSGGWASWGGPPPAALIIPASGTSGTDSTVFTDADGRASVIVTPGIRISGSPAGLSIGAQVLMLTGESPSTGWPSITIFPGPPAGVVLLSGNSQAGQVGSTLSPLQVQVQDQFGNPVNGVPALWSVTSGGGSITVVDQVTGTTGSSRAVWTLGPVVGTQTVSAGIAGGPAVTFTAQASP